MRAAIRVAVTSRSFSRHPVLRRELLDRFPLTTFNDEGCTLTGNELVAFLSGHDCAITALERLDAATLSALPGLRIISKYGVGLDMLDLEAMERRAIRLGWTKGVNCRSVAELAVGAMIALLHRIGPAQEEMRQGVWHQAVGRQLSGKTVGIIGCGHVGKDVVRLLEPFRCRILAYDVVCYSDFYREFSVDPTNLELLLCESDVVTLHVPLDNSTANLLSADRLARMKQGAVVINTARGGLVDEDALKTGLKSGRIGGAAFDVFAVEPPIDSELIALPSFMATPHIGGSTEEAILAMGRAAIVGLETARLPSEHGLLG
jgi:phosphoglycerate dehydrogenase-like enzyme